MKMETRNSKNRILRKAQGAITIFQIVPLCLIILGAICGVKLGSRFGHFGAGVGALAGAVFFWLVWWRLPLMWICKWLDRKRFSNKSIPELQAMLRDPNCKSTRLVLLELGIRGEKTENYFPIILDLLVSPLAEARLNGWLTLLSVFPERAKMISDYRVNDSVEKCREKIQKLLPVQS